MLTLLILLLFSNALVSRRDKSILFSIIIIMSLFFDFFLLYNNLHVKALGSIIAFFGGLFDIITITQFFTVFILLVTGAILSLNAFFSRKTYSFNVSNNKILTSFNVFSLIFISFGLRYMIINIVGLEDTGIILAVLLVIILIYINILFPWTIRLFKDKHLNILTIIVISAITLFRIVLHCYSSDISYFLDSIISTIESLALIYTILTEQVFTPITLNMNSSQSEPNINSTQSQPNTTSSSSSSDINFDEIVKKMTNEIEADLTKNKTSIKNLRKTLDSRLLVHREFDNRDYSVISQEEKNKILGKLDRLESLYNKNTTLRESMKVIADLDKSKNSRNENVLLGNINNLSLINEARKKLSS